jgi:hypothetical protein
MLKDCRREGRTVETSVYKQVGPAGVGRLLERRICETIELDRFGRTVLFFPRKFALDSGFHACSLEESMRATNAISLGRSLSLLVHTLITSQH